MKLFSEWVKLNESKGKYEYAVWIKPKSGGSASSYPIFAASLKGVVKDVRDRLGFKNEEIMWIRDYQANKKIEGDELAELLGMKKKKKQD